MVSFLPQAPVKTERRFTVGRVVGAIAVVGTLAVVGDVALDMGPGVVSRVLAQKDFGKGDALVPTRASSLAQFKATLAKRRESHKVVAESIVTEMSSGEPPSPPAGPKDDDTCFPEFATVTMADGSTAAINMLKEGDAIVAAKADGSLTTDTVSLLSIAKPDVEATFVTLDTEAGHTLTLTPEHHVPVGAECCSMLKQAKDVQVGEAMWTAVGATTVTRKGATISTGLFSPVLTSGSFPIVDGLVTSFDSIEGVTLHAALNPYLAPFLKALGLTNLLRRAAFKTDGIFVDNVASATPIILGAVATSA